MPPRSAAPKIAFVCQQCGTDYPKWIGKCASCGGWITNEVIENLELDDPPTRGWLVRHVDFGA
jgi:DNA repair protein RadA/Sms